ncbi:MAG: putative O-glycosylation ligase, exosortase A system-associated [Emcibacteraceae bacterium]
MRDILLALFLLSALPLVLYRYQIGGLVIAFISFMYPQSNTYGFALSVQWIDMFFVLTVGGYIVQQGYKNYQHHPLVTALIIFFLWTCVTTLFSFNMYYSYEPWVKFSKILLIAYVVYAMLNTEKRLIALIKVMVLSFGFYGIKGGLFTIISGGTAHVLGPVNSFFGDNNGMALVLVMTIPFMIYFVSNAENIYQKYFSLVCAIFTAIGVLGTQSRTGFAALVVTVLYFTWLQKKLFRAILIIAPIAFVAIYFMPQSWTDRMGTSTNLEEDASFQGRVDMWRASVKIANDHPITGGGFNVIYVPEVIVEYIPLGVRARAIHSGYFQMIAEHGYAGFMIWMGILAYTYLVARRLGRQSKDVPNMPWFKDLSIAIRSSVVGYMILAFTANIAFFDLLYFLIVITTIADNVMQKYRGSDKFDLYKPVAMAA